MRLLVERNFMHIESPKIELYTSDFYASSFSNFLLHYKLKIHHLLSLKLVRVSGIKI